VRDLEGQNLEVVASILSETAGAGFAGVIWPNHPDGRVRPAWDGSKARRIYHLRFEPPQSGKAFAPGRRTGRKRRCFV